MTIIARFFDDLFSLPDESNIIIANAPGNH